MNVGVGAAQNGSKTSSTIFQHRFSEIDHLNEHLQVLHKTQLTQLSTDPLQCDISMVALNEVFLYFGKSSCPILSKFEKPRDFIVFNFALETHGPGVISHQRRVSHDILFGFNPNLEGNVIIPANLKLAALHIRQNVLQNYLQMMDRSDLNERFWARNYLSIPVTLPTVRTYLNQLHHLILHQTSFLQQPHVQELILEDLIPLLVNAIPPVTSDIFKPPHLLARSQMIKAAEEYIMAHLEQPLTFKDLCQALHVSKTPLFNGFQEVFGVGPMEYLKVQRMHSVRRLLKAANPRTDSVTAIAQRFGFWSTGHFTRSYKQMFGELPSNTLNRI